MLGRMPSTVHALSCHNAQQLVVIATTGAHDCAQPRLVCSALARLAQWCMCSGTVLYEEVEICCQAKCLTRCLGRVDASML